MPRMNRDEQTLQLRRMLLFTIWTLIILWSMDVARPSESTWVHSISHWFDRHGMPEYTPAKLYHCGSYFLWVILLIGVLARGYWMVLSPSAFRNTVIALTLFAMSTEGLQNFNPARGPSWVDVAINVTGGAFGLLFQSFVARRTWNGQRASAGADGG